MRADDFFTQAIEAARRCSAIARLVGGEPMANESVSRSGDVIGLGRQIAQSMPSCRNRCAPRMRRAAGNVLRVLRSLLNSRIENPKSPLAVPRPFPGITIPQAALVTDSRRRFRRHRTNIAWRPHRKVTVFATQQGEVRRMLAEPRTRFEALDAWRGLAAILVALMHLNVGGHFYEWPIIRGGGAAVDFFFVLSGFVIAYAYGHKLRSVGSLPDFAIRRFGRLYPLHVFTLVALVALELAKLAAYIVLGASGGQPPFSGTNDVWSLLGNLLLINGLGFFSEFTWNGPSWSISTEFYTYFLYSAVCLLPSARLLASVVLAVTTGVLLALNDYLGDPVEVIEGAGLATTIFGFFIGVLTFSFFVRLRDAVRKPPIASEWVVTAVAIFAISAGAPATVLAPMFAVVVVVFASETGVLSRALRTSLPQHLGKISYSIYLVHFPVLAAMNGIGRLVDQKLTLGLYAADPLADGTVVITIGGLWVGDLWCLTYVTIVVGVATLTFRFIEDPSRRFFNAVANNRSARSQLRRAQLDTIDA
jgi:peptidoglycan/LPS O-acetylase OafA/YrhL